jgi:hypothetical protein
VSHTNRFALLVRTEPVAGTTAAAVSELCATSDALFVVVLHEVALARSLLSRHVTNILSSEFATLPLALLFAVETIAVTATTCVRERSAHLTGRIEEENGKVVRAVSWIGLFVAHRDVRGVRCDCRCLRLNGYFLGGYHSFAPLFAGRLIRESVVVTLATSILERQARISTCVVIELFVLGVARSDDRRKSARILRVSTILPTLFDRCEIVLVPAASTISEALAHAVSSVVVVPQFCCSAVSGFAR